MIVFSQEEKEGTFGQSGVEEVEIDDSTVTIRYAKKRVLGEGAFSTVFQTTNLVYFSAKMFLYLLVM